MQVIKQLRLEVNGKMIFQNHHPATTQHGALDSLFPHNVEPHCNMSLAKNRSEMLYTFIIPLPYLGLFNLCAHTAEGLQSIVERFDSIKATHQQYSRLLPMFRLSAMFGS